jgi:glutamate dehydrogenase
MEWGVYSMNTERLYFEKRLSQAIATRKDLTDLEVNFIRQLALSLAAHELIEYDIDYLIEHMHQHWIRFKTHKPLPYVLQLSADHDRQTTSIHIIHQNYPFLIDTLTLLLKRIGLAIEMIFCIKITTERDLEDVVISFDENASQEASLLMIIPYLCQEERLNELESLVQEMLAQIQSMVDDFQNMKAACLSLTNSLIDDPAMKDFLLWILDNRYVFFSLECFEKKSDSWVIASDGKNLGVVQEVGLLDDEVTCVLAERTACVFAKDTVMSTLHRAAYRDVFYIKKYDSDGVVLKIYRITGLLTSEVYQCSLQDIPWVNNKVDRIFQYLDIEKDSYEGRKLQHQFTLFNRNDIFYTSFEELLNVVSGLYYLRDRPVVKLFLLAHPCSHSLIAYVYMPRDLFNSTVRIKVQEILFNHFQATECSFEPLLSESNLARIRFELRGPRLYTDLTQRPLIEEKLRHVTCGWQEQFYEQLKNNLEAYLVPEYLSKFSSLFSASYQEFYEPHDAIKDVFVMNNLNADHPVELCFFKTGTMKPHELRLKLFQYDQSLELSAIIPILENFGLKIINDRLFELKLKDNVVWLNDLLMHVHESNNQPIFNESLYKEVSEVFKRVLNNTIENDGFNKLIMIKGLTARQTILIRAWSKYLWQITFPFSQKYIEDVCAGYSTVIESLIKYFEVKFKPVMIEEQRMLKMQALEQSIELMLDALLNLDADKILRKLYNLVQSIVRTNYYQTDASGAFKEYVSFKFNPHLLTEMPLPLMQHEVFVYAAHAEGIHLRSSDVARGGIRWSDRVEDYRTEVLGLVKAQQVKNSIIVPSGAKGGFIVRNQSLLSSKEAILKAGIEAYKTLMRGLLDLTDNLVDEQDPYLVVAADKGTATFSDIANELSAAYNYWLGDAFASGGSQGYDHKKIGITARGAFESVKNHFIELGINIETESFTALGIGDMSGDVFGNGALLTPTMKLVAAFNHLDIFIDPNPDVVSAYQERKRLFTVAKGSWSDYNPALISQGGGVFSRKLKSIALTPEMRLLLNIEKEKMTPSELIHTLLKMKVDLIFNGGIGTYVKASSEQDHEVGDKQNDALRVNGSMLRCKVFAEGGNLGVTQRGRIEYAQCGGKINTDTLDNSGGVDCSDHEVNIKILLDFLISKASFDKNQRAALLLAMTEEIAQLVLTNNRDQNAVISMMQRIAVRDLKLHQDIIQDLTKRGCLDRDLEFLPTDEEIKRRLERQEGLVTPELIVLMSYVKMDLKAQLAQEDFTDYPLIAQQLLHEFPPLLIQTLGDKVFEHPLKNKIIATMVANIMINEVGLSFVYRMRSETSASYLSIVHCYFLARELFDNRRIRSMIAALDKNLGANFYNDLKIQFNRMLYRATRWLLKRKQFQQSQPEVIEPLKRSIDELRMFLVQRESYQRHKTYAVLFEAKVSEETIYYLATLIDLLPALEIHLLATQEAVSVTTVFPLYKRLGDRLRLDELRVAIDALVIHSEWDALARNFLRDDLDQYQLRLTQQVLRVLKEKSFESWEEDQAEHLHYWEEVCLSFNRIVDKSFVNFSVSIRALERFLIQ